MPSPTSVLGSGKISSTRSSARIGPPAAILPTTGTYVAAGIASPDPVSSTAASSGVNTDNARGRFGSRLMKPFSSSMRSWCATDEELVSPTRSPISRMLGG